MSSEYISELKKWANELDARAAEAQRAKEGEVPLDRAVDLIGKTFAVQNHEVAILGLTPDGRSLRFIAPQTLRQVGQIPLSSTNSLAARTARERRPEIINHFSVVPHASVFEAVPIAESQRGDAIQKIMSSPIMSGGKPIGVAQISRKGKSAADAGPDFTHAQLRELKLICDAIAPCLLLNGKE
jgi:hypothetical protein